MPRWQRERTIRFIFFHILEVLQKSKSSSRRLVETWRYMLFWEGNCLIMADKQSYLTKMIFIKKTQIPEIFSLAIMVAWYIHWVKISLSDCHTYLKQNTNFLLKMKKRIGNTWCFSNKGHLGHRFWNFHLKPEYW